LSAAAAASAGICTTLKYQSSPIHITPERMWNQRARPSSMNPVGAIRKVMTSATTNPVVMAPRTVFKGFMETPPEVEIRFATAG